LGAAPAFFFPSMSISPAAPLDVRPIAGRPKEWAIAIYGGRSLSTLAPLHGDDRPALTFSDIVDLPARFVADPFLVRDGQRWLLFFEVMNAARESGEIALASSDDEGLSWRYDGIIVKERYHLSYPYVFRAGEEWLMTPEALETGGVVLYRADDFPRRWSLDCMLLPGQWADPTVFEHDGLWWMFACSTPFRHDRLELFWSEDVRGPWRPHPHNPIVSGDPLRARPAGRPRLIDGQLVRFAQDCRPDYGAAVRAFNITTLTPDDYAEEELPARVIAATGSGWNADGMHTVDAHPSGDGWLAAVDGYSYITALHYDLVTTLPELDALAAEWETLLRRSGAHRVFSSFAWTRAALAAGGGRSPHVVTLRRNDELLALLPFLRTAEGVEFPTYLSDYNDFIAAEQLLAARAFNWSLDTLPSGSRMVMRGLREGSDALAIARAYAPHSVITEEASCLYATIPDTLPSYLALRSRAFRKSYGRARRAAEAAGVTVQRLPADREAAELFLDLNQRRFGERSRFAGEAMRTFVREALPPLLASGDIRIYAVMRGQEVLAVDVVLISGEAVAPWNGGFAPRAAAFSPGRLLFAAEIEEAAATGLTRFDLLRGSHPYKLPWSDGSLPLYRAEVIIP
jgi:CelD/BcsL family acetyltransferase involved in cellulose biosynthesis